MLEYSAAMKAPTLSEALYDYLSSPDYEPQEMVDIARGMGLHPSQRSELKALLAEGVRKGNLIKQRKSLYILRKLQGEPLTGRISQRGSRLFFVADAGSARQLQALRPGGGCGGTAGKSLPQPRRHGW